MKKKNIKDLVIEARCDFLVFFIVTTIVFSILYYMFYQASDDHSITLFLLVVYLTINLGKFTDVVVMQRVLWFAKRKKISLSDEVLWWNGKNCILLNDRIIIAKSMVKEFDYSDIKTIQKEEGYQRSRNSSPIKIIYLIFCLSSGKKYKIKMFSYSVVFEAYNNIEDVTDILLEKNPNISVLEFIPYSLRDSIF